MEYSPRDKIRRFFGRELKSYGRFTEPVIPSPFIFVRRILFAKRVVYSGGGGSEIAKLGTGRISYLPKPNPVIASH